MLPSYTIIGKNRLHFETIESTNDFAMDLVSKTNPIEGTVVSADFQSKGKGQYGRVWHGMAHQNIAASIILYPQFLFAQEQFYISKAIAIGVLNFVKSLHTNDVSIKWPNDIYINDQKVAGVLIQNVLSGNKLKTSIVGIGINVFQTEFQTGLQNPTSLILNGLSPNTTLTDLYHKLFHSIEEVYELLKKRFFDLLDQQYFSHLWNKEGEIKYRLADSFEEKIGKMIHVGKEGQLSMMDDDGLISHFSHGEIVFILPKNE